MIDVSLLIHGLLVVFLLIAAISDVTRFVIPNWLVIMMLLLYPVMLWLTTVPVAWPEHSLMFVGVLAIGIALFSAGVLGGGDAKLLAACALWLGMERLLPFLILMALIGGAMAMVLLVLRPLIKRVWPMLRVPYDVPKLLTPKAPIPYGVAISVAMMWMMYFHSLPGLLKPIEFMVTY